METWKFILALAILNSMFGAFYTIIKSKRGSNISPYNKSVAELKISMGEATFGDYVGLFFAAFIGGIFTLRNLLYSPISVLIIYFIK